MTILLLPRYYAAHLPWRKEEELDLLGESEVEVAEDEDILDLARSSYIYDHPTLSQKPGQTTRPSSARSISLGKPKRTGSPPFVRWIWSYMVNFVCDWELSFFLLQKHKGKMAKKDTSADFRSDGESDILVEAMNHSTSASPGKQEKKTAYNHPLLCVNPSDSESG
jgi:hypothetical protein